MLQYAADINRTVNGLGAIISNQAPAIRLLVSNWPITLLAGAALGTRLLYRHKKGELTSFNVVTDAGAVLVPVVALFTLQKLGQEREALRATPATASAPTIVQKL